MDERNDSQSNVAFTLLEDFESVAGAAGSERFLRRSTSIVDVVDLVVRGSVYEDSEHVRKEKMRKAATSLLSKRNIFWFIFFLILGVTLLPLSFLSANKSDIPLTLSQALLLLYLSICALLTALWKCGQILMVSMCCRSDPSNVPECFLSPGWTILFLFLSLFLAMSCTFGLVTYPSEVTYPFGVSITFGVLSFVLFVLSTIGFNTYCRCCRVFVMIWEKVSFWVCLGFVIWDIISDILAALKVYRHHDYHFFVISVSFTTITFLLYWLTGLYLLREERALKQIFNADWDDPNSDYYDDEGHKRYHRFKDNWRWTLYIPIVSMITITIHVPGSPLIALAFSSFPQYIISLSFILEHGVKDFFNIMALSMSLFQLLTSPFFTTTVAFLKLSVTSKQEKKRMARMETKHAAQTGFAWFLFYLVFLLPILLLEIIHFCPILFEYYLYDGLSYHDLVIYLLCFNVPKLIFIGVTIEKDGSFKPEAPKQAIKYIAEIQDLVDRKEKWWSYVKFTFLFLLYGTTFLVLPLVPVTLFCLASVGVLVGAIGNSEDTRKVAYMVRSNLFILALYLLISYGGMGRMLLNQRMHEISFWMLILTWILSFWILLLPVLTPAYFMFFNATISAIPEDCNLFHNPSGLQHLRNDLPMIFQQAMCSVFCPCCYSGYEEPEKEQNEMENELKRKVLEQERIIRGLKQQVRQLQRDKEIDGMEARLQNADGAILPVCKCGRELKKCLMLEAYDGGGIICDACYSTIDSRDQHIYHCPDGKNSEIHPDGYDLCRLCGCEQMMDLLQLRFVDTDEL